MSTRYEDIWEEMKRLLGLEAGKLLDKTYFGEKSFFKDTNYLDVMGLPRKQLKELQEIRRTRDIILNLIKTGKGIEIIQNGEIEEEEEENLEEEEKKEYMSKKEKKKRWWNRKKRKDETEQKIFELLEQKEQLKEEIEELRIKKLREEKQSMEKEEYPEDFKDTLNNFFNLIEEKIITEGLNQTMSVLPAYRFPAIAKDRIGDSKFKGYKISRKPPEFK